MCIIEVWPLQAAIIGCCINRFNILVKLLMKQRGTPIITPADNGHNRSADTVSATTICVNISPPSTRLRWSAAPFYTRVDSFRGLKNQLSAQVPPQGAASGAPGALIPPEKKGFANYRRLVLMQMMRGMEGCLVIVVQRSGSLLLHWAPLDVSTSGCFDISPSHPFFPPLFCHTKVLPGILTKHCCILPDGNAGKGLPAWDTTASTRTAETGSACHWGGAAAQFIPSNWIGSELVWGFRNDHGLLHIVAGVKRLLMKLKSREIYSGTWPESSATLAS